MPPQLAPPALPGCMSESLIDGRLEHALGAIACNALAAGAGIEPRDAPGVVRRDRRLPRQRRRCCRIRAGGRRVLARHRVLRHGFFDDGENGGAAVAVEGVQKAGLGGLNHRRHVFAIVHEIRQRGLRAHVIVPDIVVHQLLSPFERTGVALQCHHGIGPPVIARSFAPKEIGAGRAGGRKHQMTAGIHRQRCPGIGGTGGRHPFRAPLLEHGIRWITRNGIPAPNQFAASRVEGPNAAEFFEHRAIVADGRADDHLAVEDRGRRGDEIVAPLIALP